MLFRYVPLQPHKPLLRQGEQDRITVQNITSVLLIIISYGR